MKANRTNHRAQAAGPARRRRTAVAILSALAALAGCDVPPEWKWPPPAASQPAAKPRAVKPSVLMDPCADRLGDICGQLLLYARARHDLPESLASLAELTGRPMPATCPLSGRPYIYSRDGLPMPNTPRRVLVYDALPCHTGMRWTITADPAGPGKPLVARVQLVPDDPAIFAAPPPPAPSPGPATRPTPAAKTAR
jgi:hypothetical protein